ncbi:MAG: ribonuclease HI family protein [Parcubacteria group bacterium]|nr:ribonuclease HI family protein [Parcubacteria group bacterium]
MVRENKLILWTDGGSRRNPGPAAIGVVFQGMGGKEYSEYIGETTNNAAEYKAVVFGLKKAKQLFGKKNAEKMKVEIRLDSELVGKQMLGKYKILEPDLQPLFLELWNLRQDFGDVQFKVVPRSENKVADRLVNEELDRQTANRRLF